jgi:hypothetical protein
MFMQFAIIWWACFCSMYIGGGLTAQWIVREMEKGGKRDDNR